MKLFIEILINGILNIWFVLNVFFTLLIVGGFSITLFDDKVYNHHLYETKSIYVDSFQVKKAYEGKYNHYFAGRYQGLVYSKDLNSYKMPINTNNILKNDGNIPIPNNYIVVYRDDIKIADLVNSDSYKIGDKILKSPFDIFLNFIKLFIPTLISIFINLKIAKKLGVKILENE